MIQQEKSKLIILKKAIYSEWMFIKIGGIHSYNRKEIMKIDIWLVYILTTFRLFSPISTMTNSKLSSVIYWSLNELSLVLLSVVNWGWF